ncbi:hypothetical protein [Desertivirga xinjiangensis]|uniref:hypothetical protein n=1 Tax=Desertivirga xinjiangensis TaxID=539206 RepID=UPI00210D6674|nr:hypothetical protein [Pedobacter xinjiangensis]
MHYKLALLTFIWASASAVQAPSVFPHYTKEKKIEGDRDEKVGRREHFIADNIRWWFGKMELTLT